MRNRFHCSERCAGRHAYCTCYILFYEAARLLMIDCRCGFEDLKSIDEIIKIKTKNSFEQRHMIYNVHFKQNYNTVL